MCLFLVGAMKYTGFVIAMKNTELNPGIFQAMVDSNVTSALLSGNFLDMAGTLYNVTANSTKLVSISDLLYNQQRLEQMANTLNNLQNSTAILQDTLNTRAPSLSNTSKGIFMLIGITIGGRAFIGISKLTVIKYKLAGSCKTLVVFLHLDGVVDNVAVQYIINHTPTDIGTLLTSGIGGVATFYLSFLQSA